MTRYVVEAASSTLLVTARSSMGPIAFETSDLAGWLEVAVAGSEVSADDLTPSAVLEVRLTTLRSGNDLYDAELRRRIDARRFPTCTLKLDRTTPLSEGHFSLGGTITFHGATKPLTGTVDVEVLDEDRLSVVGVKELDLRDFDLEPPGMLMMKIYPEVQVQLFIAAVADREVGGST